MNTIIEVPRATLYGMACKVMKLAAWYSWWCAANVHPTGGRLIPVQSASLKVQLDHAGRQNLHAVLLYSSGSAFSLENPIIENHRIPSQGLQKFGFKAKNGCVENDVAPSSKATLLTSCEEMTSCWWSLLCFPFPTGLTRFFFHD